MNNKYISKAIPKEITAVSRASFKVNNNFYTFEYSETRILPQVDTIDIEKERKILWDICNKEVDDQINIANSLYI